MDPLRSVVLWTHLAGIVVWFGAVAYFLFVLRPAVRSSGMERHAWYALLRSIKRRLRIVVGIAVLALVSSGLVLAWWRGFLSNPPWVYGRIGWIFLAKMGVVALLIVIYLTALGTIARIQVPRTRGRVFVGVHIVALGLGSIAAFLGLLLSG